MQNGYSQSYHGHGGAQQQYWPQAGMQSPMSPPGQHGPMQGWPHAPEMSQVPTWASASGGGPYVSAYVMSTPALPGGMALPGAEGGQPYGPGAMQQTPSQQGKMPRPRNSHVDRSQTMPPLRQSGSAVAQAHRLKSALRRGSAGGHHGHSNGHHHRSGSLTAVPTNATAADLAHTGLGLGPGGMPNLSRQRTNSRPGHPDRSQISLAGIPISRQNSTIALDAPDHLFVTFNSSNEMVLDQLNPAKDVVEPILSTVLPMWEGGTQHDTSKPSRLRVRFDGSPWSSQGHQAITAYRMIIQLFHIFAHTGYQWLAQVDVAHPMRPPRQVFAGKVPDRNAHFFVITFSRTGHKMTLVDPPGQVGDTLPVSIRTAFKGQITSDYPDGEGVHVIEFKRNVFGTPEADKTIITGYVLKYIKTLGYKLVATVPLARKGMLGLGGRKELWMFQGPPHKRMDID